MANLGLLLLVFSFVFFCLAVYRSAQPEFNKLLALGLAALVAAELFGGIVKIYTGH